MAALAERPRPRGRPRFTGEDRLKVIAAATAIPPGADTAWSHQRLAEHLPELGISASQIGRILSGADLKPHLVRGWLTRPADRNSSTRPPTLTGRVLRRGQFTSRNELADRIDEFVLAYDEHDAKPYRWTYDGNPLKAA